MRRIVRPLCDESESGPHQPPDLNGVRHHSTGAFIFHREWEGTQFHLVGGPPPASHVCNAGKRGLDRPTPWIVPLCRRVQATASEVVMDGLVAAHRVALSERDRSLFDARAQAGASAWLNLSPHRADRAIKDDDLLESASPAPLVRALAPPAVSLGSCGASGSPLKTRWRRGSRGHRLWYPS